MRWVNFLMLIIAVKEDFIDQHAVSSIKEKLPYVMPVSCYRLGIDGANIVFQSKVSGITLSLNAIETCGGYVNIHFELPVKLFLQHIKRNRILHVVGWDEKLISIWLCKSLCTVHVVFILCHNREYCCVQIFKDKSSLLNRRKIWLLGHYIAQKY